MKNSRFDSPSLRSAQEFMSRVFTPTRLRAASPAPAGLGAERWESEDFFYTELSLAGAVDLTIGTAPGRMGLLAVHAGTYVDTTGGRHDIYRPGAAAVVTDCALPRTGKARGALRATVATFDPRLLGAGGTSGHDGTVAVAGPNAVDAAAGRQITGTLAYLRHTVLTAPGDEAPAATGIRHLAAVVGTALPPPAPARPGGRHDDPNEQRATAGTDTLRRARRYIDANAHCPITLDDIAAAAFVTPRAVQYAFRRHNGLTPLGYLRQVRMDHAHRELLAACPATGSVTEIGARWGFPHPGRFAALYRAIYGRTPSTTLRQHPPGATGQDTTFAVGA